MVLKSLISAALMTVFTVQATRAEGVCDTVENVLGVLAEVRSIHIDGYPVLAPEKLERLDARLSSISLEGVYALPAGPDPDGRKRRDGVIHLIQDSQAALAAFRAGDVESAASRLHTSIPVALDQTLSDLQRTQNCRPVTMRGNGLNMSNGQTSSAVSGTNGLRERTGGSTETLKAGTGESAKTGAPANARPSKVQSVAAFDFAANWKTLLGLAGLVAAAAVHIVRRNQREDERRTEQRLLCELRVPARIGKKEFIITIVDVTRQGMKVQHSGAIHLRRPVEISLGGEIVKAKVSWHNPIFAGLRLTKPLTDSQFELVSRSAHAITADGE